MQEGVLDPGVVLVVVGGHLPVAVEVVGAVAVARGVLGVGQLAGVQVALTAQVVGVGVAPVDAALHVGDGDVPPAVGRPGAGDRHAGRPLGVMARRRGLGAAV